MAADDLKALRRHAAGQPVDRAAAQRYVEDGLPDLGEVLTLCRSTRPGRRKTGLLRAAAVVAAADERSRRSKPTTKGTSGA